MATAVTTHPTCSSRMVAVTYTTNTATDRASSATATVTVREAAARSVTLSNASAVRAKAKAARKTPNAVLVTGERTKMGMTRGDICELAS